MIKAKNEQLKKRKHEICKTYRNNIVDLWESVENSNTRHTSKKIKKALELSGKTFMILSILKKVKRAIHRVPF